VIVVLEADEGRLGAVASDGIDADMFDEAAAVQVRFEIDGAQAALEGILVHKDIPDAGGHFAADAKAIGLRGEVVIADDNILRRLSDAPAILVTAGFDRYSIVTDDKVAILDQDIGGRLGVAAIVVQVEAVDRYVLDSNVIAKNRMDHLVYKGSRFAIINYVFYLVWTNMTL
jgi:hypothetical protein